MKIEYIPGDGFKLNSTFFKWGDDRKSIRNKLNNQHKEDDTIIEMAEFFDGDTSYDIEQKKDVYQDINNSKNYFFLSYDKENRINQLEVHWGINIIIKDIEMAFNKNINIYLDKLASKGYERIEIEEGNYFYKDLKMVIADSESMGGDGGDLSYFYSSKNIEHLVENQN